MSTKQQEKKQQEADLLNEWEGVAFAPQEKLKEHECEFQLKRRKK